MNLSVFFLLFFFNICRSILNFLRLLIFQYFSVSSDESTLGILIIITTKKVLELIEASYPNPITPQEMAR